jgi:uncharacterized membrane protein
MNGNDKKEVAEILDEAKNLSKEKQFELAMSFQMYIGPIPHPALIKEYENIHPGAAKIIFDSFTLEGNHRRKLELSDYKLDRNLSYLGLLFGFIIALIAILAGVYLALTDHPVVGTVLSGGTVVALVTLFTGGRAKNKDK